MKKALTFMVVAALAMSASAASFIWGGGSQIHVIGDDGSVTGWNEFTEGGTTGYLPDQGYLALFYIGQSGSLNGIGDLSSGDAVATITTTVLTGKANNQIAPSTYEATDAEYTAGATFEIFWVSESGSLQNIFATDGTTAFNEQLTLNDLDPLANVDDFYASGGSTVNYAVNATPVPEPATAALAIAGLAMLIRRRK